MRKIGLAVLISLFILGIAAVGPAGAACGVVNNPINNCGFETGDFTGWVTQDLTDPFYPLSVIPAGFTMGFGLFTSAPTEGNYAAFTGFDGNGPGTIKLGQDVSLPVGSKTLTFDYRAGWDMFNFFGSTQDRTFTVTIEPAGGGSPLQTDAILSAQAATMNPDTGNQTGSVDVSAFAGQTVRISFNWDIPESYTGPASFQLDNVAVQVVAPVPAMGGWGMILFSVLAGLGAVFSIARRRRAV